MSGATRLLLLEYRPNQTHYQQQQQQQQRKQVKTLTAKTQSVTAGVPQLRRAETTVELNSVSNNRLPPQQPQYRQPLMPLPRSSKLRQQPTLSAAAPLLSSSPSRSLLIRQRQSMEQFNSVYGASRSPPRRFAESSGAQRGATAVAGRWSSAANSWTMDSNNSVWATQERCQQRRQIYALNKLMTELEEANYLAFKASQQAS